MQRIVPGLLIAGLWLLLLLKGPLLLFHLVVAVVVLLGADEFLRMIDSRPIHFFERLLINLLLCLPVFVTCVYPHPAAIAPGVLTGFGGLAAYALWRYQQAESAFNLFSRQVFGLVYIGILAAHVVLLRHLPEGASWLIIASAITACSDSGAYFVGRSVGKHKLARVISPNKTIEGAIGGVLAGLLAALFFGVVLLPTVNWPFLVLAAIFLGLIGIAGDLCESVIKRATGTKDSGRLLRGHGGILDRVDSLLFVCPILYYLLSWSQAL